MTVPKKELLFLALGGSGEIGMNVNLYGCDGKWVMVDCGITFADPNYPGVDVILPDPIPGKGVVLTAVSNFWFDRFAGQIADHRADIPLTDVLTGVIGGGGYGLTPYSEEGKMDVSHTLTALDIEWFMPLDEFKRRMDDFTSMMKSRALRPGFSEVLIPGEQEARRVARKSAVGVPLENPVLDDLRALGAELGVEAEIAVVGPWEDTTL